VRILFCAVPGYGHVYPLMPLAVASAARGHDVQFATGPPFVGELPVPTVDIVSPDVSLGWVEQETFRRHPELATLPPDQGWRIPLELFGDVTCELLRDGLMPRVEAWRPDLVVYDVYAVGAAVAAHACGVPAIPVGIAQWSIFSVELHRAVLDRQEQFWRRYRVERPSWPSALGVAYIDTIPPSLQGGDISTLSNRVPLRSVAWSAEGAGVPGWLLERPTRPRLYVTLGTVSYGAVPVLQAVLDASRTIDCEVLVTVGPKGDPGVLGAQPENIHVERFVAQDRVLPLVDAAVHHGGTGTLLAAFAEGLPQVLIPQGADQFQNAGVFARIGAGRALMPPEVASPSLAQALQAVLHDSSTRAAAEAVKVEIRKMPPPSDVVGSIEKLATRRPPGQ